MDAGTSGPATPPPCDKDDAPYDIFLSLRLSEAKQPGYADALKAALEAKRPSLRCFLSGGNPFGATIGRIIPDALGRSRMAVVMGTETYGLDTGSNFGTLQEMQFILKYFKRDKGRAFFPIKMCHAFDQSVPQTEMSMFMSDGNKYYVWVPTPAKTAPPDAILEELDAAANFESQLTFSMANAMIVELLYCWFHHR